MDARMPEGWRLVAAGAAAVAVVLVSRLWRPQTMRQPVGLHEIDEDLDTDLVGEMAALMVVEIETYLARRAEFEARYPER